MNGCGSTPIFSDPGSWPGDGIVSVIDLPFKGIWPGAGAVLLITGGEAGGWAWTAGRRTEGALGGAGFTACPGFLIIAGGSGWGLNMSSLPGFALPASKKGTRALSIKTFQTIRRVFIIYLLAGDS